VHDVAELHPRLLQQVFGDTEHGEGLLVGVLTQPVETARVEPGLLADVDPQAVERAHRHNRRRAWSRSVDPQRGLFGRTGRTA
jgi:hypothetical protein